MQSSNQLIFICLLLAILNPIHVKSQLVDGQVIVAYDCGNPQGHSDSDGIQYIPDTGFSYGTHIADYLETFDQKEFKYTLHPFVYLTQRHCDHAFSYVLPLKEQGTYTLNLKFAELYFKEKNKRVFDVAFGNDLVISNLDIFDKVGYMAALDEYVEFEYRENKIFVNNKLCVDAYDKVLGGLKVNFKPGQFDFPQLDGLVLFAGQKKYSSQAQYLNTQNNWSSILKDREEIKQQSDKQVIQGRHKIIQDETDDIDENLNQQSGNFDGLKSILFSTKGFLIIATLGFAIIILLLLKDPAVQNEKNKQKQQSKIQTKSEVKKEK